MYWSSSEQRVSQLHVLLGPMSHVACRPVIDSVLGEALDDPADIARINQRVKARSLDLLQADHVLAGVDTALWDLLGRRLGEPVWKLLGQTREGALRPLAHHDHDLVDAIRLVKPLPRVGHHRAPGDFQPEFRDAAVVRQRW